ncbi:MAG: archaeosortase/exosortase family protein [Pirellulaceae bacterium]|nr:archaeosortase/exosortase family protein [Pirellulaceae bacterium]
MDNQAAVSRKFLYSITLGAGVVALMPLLVKQCYRLASSPMWWFTPLTLFFFLYLVWRSQYVGVTAHPIRRWTAMGLMMFAALIGVAATIAESANFAHLSLIMLVTGWALIHQGIVPWTRVIACCSVLWVAWPLPLALTERIESRLNREAVSAASGVLDQLGVKHLATATTLDLKTTRLDLSAILGGAGSLPALLFATLVILLFTRHPLLLSLMALGSAVVISWQSSVLMILLQVWTVENSTVNLGSGWMLVATQVAMFVFELMMLMVSLYSISYLFDAVPVDSSRKADKGWHGLFNRAVVWPMNFVAIQDEGPAYLEDDDLEDDLPKKVVSTRARLTPSVTATRNATDPFASQLRLFYATLACLALTGALAVLGLVFPPRVVDFRALAQSATQMENVTGAPDELAGMALIGQLPIGGADESMRAVAWNYSLPGGLASLTLEYPRSGPAVSQTLEGWTQADVPRSYTVGGWNMVESEYVNSIGKRGYSWVAAIDRKGSNYSQGGLVSRSIAKLKRSVLGRALGMSVDDVTYHSRLIVQPSSSLAMQQREEMRTAFASATASIAQTLAGQAVTVQGGN